MRPKGGELEELRSLAAVIRKSAAADLSSLGCVLPPEGISVPGRSGAASVPLIRLGKDLGAELSSRLEAGSVLSSRFVSGGNQLCYTLQDGFIKRQIALALALNSDPSVKDTVMIPMPGVAADEEAAAYAAARLIACYRCAKPFIRRESSMNALLRCLMLPGEGAASLRGATASAVRAVLDSLKRGEIGGEEALAMAALLDHADELLKNQEY